MRLGRDLRHGLDLLLPSATGWLPSQAMRQGLLRAAGADLAHGIVLYHGYQVRNPRGLSIGEDSSIGDGAILDARGGLRIGRSVNLSTRVQIWTAQHDWKSEDFAYEEASVEVGDRCWLGPSVIVLPGSRIGEGAVVGAGAVVKGELAPWGLYGGVPARRIADRPRLNTYRLLDGGTPWFW